MKLVDYLLTVVTVTIGGCGLLTVIVHLWADHKAHKRIERILRGEDK